MSLFRKTFGTPMTTFIIQHRISHAQQLLVTTDDNTLNIPPKSQPFQRSLQSRLRMLTTDASQDASST
ncbi:hypothetical protein [Planctomycetes bacterium K23_9]|uniref:Uncharacterized protein n=1 Tax=Stieleria marina TaxID=1930275 RepID=A0A517NUM2_9BACT|nr:hypothetical protein K239x_28190 [Planctomycetes bacterium K23_9]